MRRYLSWVLAHRIAVLLMIAALTGVAGYGVSRGVIASSVIKLFFGDSPAYLSYRELANEFAGNDVMVFAFEDESIFTTEGAKRLQRMAEQIGQLEYVKRVDSIASLSHISAEGDDLIIEPYVDQATDNPNVLLSALRKDPLASGWIVSDTSPATALLVELAPDPNRPIEVVPKMLEEVISKIISNGIPRERLHSAGVVPESTEATKQARFTLERLFPVTMVLLALVVFVLFLRIWPVIITGGVALISIVWTFALAIIIDPEVNLLMAMVPGMITVIAFSDIIHLYSAFVRKCELGLSQFDAALESGTEVGTACLFTSLTTFVGFASIVFIPTPVIRHLGIVLGAGVGIALLLALTLVPVVLSYVPGIASGEKAESLMTSRILDRFLTWARRTSLTFPKSITVAFGAVFAVAIFGMSQLEVDSSFAKRLDPDNQIRVGQRFIAEHFAAANFLDVYLIAPEGKDFLDADTFARVAKFQTWLAARTEVDGVLSIVDLVGVLHHEMGGVGSLPAKRDLLAQYLLLFEVSGGEGLTQLINEERNKIRFTVRLKDDGLRALAYFGDVAKVEGETILEEGITVVPTGITYLLGDWITFTLDGQRRGLFFAVLSTTLMMMICLGSIRVGLLSMIPNILPLMVLGGYCGLAWDLTDSDTLLVAIFAIGIAVDDTIHFLTRFRQDCSENEDVDQALIATFSFTGRAIVQTTVILCIGFLPFAWSDYFSTKIIGTLLPMCLVVALIADLFLVPALVKLGWLRFRQVAPRSLST